jgi:hypothetical protein
MFNKLLVVSASAVESHYNKRLCITPLNNKGVIHKRFSCSMYLLLPGYFLTSGEIHLLTVLYLPSTTTL